MQRLTRLIKTRCPIDTVLENKIHVWHTKLEQHSKDLSLFQTWLSEEEVLRVKKLAPPLCQRFILCRGILRKLLSSYSNQSPEQIQFAYTETGKPIFIRPSPSSNLIEFNLSHSKNNVAFAFTYHTPVGIDIEYRRQIKNFDKIAYRFFSADEYEQWKNSTDEEKLTTFFDLWVRTEARSKALGTGLKTHPSSKYHANKTPSKLVAAKDICRIHSFTLHPDFAAALAICGENKALKINALDSIT